MECFPDNLLLLRFRVPREELGKARLPVVVEHQRGFNHFLFSMFFLANSISFGGDAA